MMSRNVTAIQIDDFARYKVASCQVKCQLRNITCFTNAIDQVQPVVTAQFLICCVQIYFVCGVNDNIMPAFQKQCGDDHTK